MTTKYIVKADGLYLLGFDEKDNFVFGADPSCALLFDDEADAHTAADHAISRDTVGVLECVDIFAVPNK